MNREILLTIVNLKQKKNNVITYELPHIARNLD